MRNLGWMLLTFLLLTACNTERNQQREAIKGMEQAVERNDDDTFLRPLIANYLQYAKDFKEDELAPIYLYRCAVIYYRARNSGEARIHLETILREYPETAILEDTYLFLAMLEAHPTGHPKRAEELYEIYLEKYPNGKGKTDADFFFLPEEKKLQHNIDKILKDIDALPRGIEPSETQFMQLIYSYAKLIEITPEDPFAPLYCLKGARLAIRLEEHLIATQFLEEIYHNYPDFDQYPNALLLLAVEYDTNLTLFIRKGKLGTSTLTEHINTQNLVEIDPIARGKALYEEILKRFPETDVAESARYGLKNLGKKTDEVVDEFIRMQDSIQIK
ncbi:MAG: tetratricopeptide repeat protein [Aureispira sp.]